MDLLKPPGVAESLDWARCLVALGRSELDVETAAATLGAVCKYREDAERVRSSLGRLLALPGRLTRSGRQLTLHLPKRWPWAEPFAAALDNLRAVVLVT